VLAAAVLSGGGKPMENRNRIRFLAAVVFMLCAGIVLVILSPFGCWVLPAQQTERFVRLYAKPDILFFRVEGYHLCPITAEGFFPPWDSTARVRMVDRLSFLTMKKELFVYPTDFVIEGAEITSGSLRIDKKKSEVNVSLDFNRGFGRLDPVNGTYSMINVKPAISLPPGVDP
jgi:hypothetical protein